MKIDEDLLANATPGGPMILRMYSWARPTLSLGHFQSDVDVSVTGLTGHSDWVTRKTGGGAILHHHEITYSLIIPAREEQQRKGANEEIYRAVHCSIRDGLRELGIAAELSENCTCTWSSEGRDQAFLCFLRRSPVDLVVGSNKILGSAQRRTRRGLLQHGSFLIRHSPLLPALLGIEDLAEFRPVLPWMETSIVDDREGWTRWTASRIQVALSSVTDCSWDESELKDSSYLLRFVDVGSGGPPSPSTIIE